MFFIKSFNKNIGSYGEDLSSNFLKSLSYKIIDKNFRYKKGELDIICTFDNLLIFIEVKSRYSNSFGYPLESITYSKQKQIIKLSSIYILKHKLHNMNIRYDVIEVMFNINNDDYSINHIKDAFRTY